MSECSWGGCGREAKWQIEIRLWALCMDIMQRTPDNCVKMLHSVTVCDECRTKVKVQDFLLPEGKERIANALARVGREVTDFDRAGLHFVEIVGEPLNFRDMIPPGAEVIEG